MDGSYLEVHGIKKFENPWHDKPEVLMWIETFFSPYFSLKVWCYY